MGEGAFKVCVYKDETQERNGCFELISKYVGRMICAYR